MREPVSISDRFEPRIESALVDLGYSLAKPGRLADAILRLSDFYLRRPDARSPLAEPWAQAAYLAYYFPLNLARARAVAREGARLGFFSGIDRIVDFGSGLGSASFAALEAAPAIAEAFAIDASAEALRLQEKLAADDWPTARFRREARADAAPPASFRGGGAAQRTCAIFSYSLTELARIPAWALDQEALFIVEPSSRDDGRRLQSLRSDLLASGFYAWAPCSHQGACPLLAQSERDWCHARVALAAPPWWGPIEALLPIKNRTLSFSYLLARRTKPAREEGLARAIGDARAEKGKTRMAICRGPEREFLAWFPQRLREPPDLERGDLLRLAADLEKRGAEGAREVRLRTAADAGRVGVAISAHP